VKRDDLGDALDLAEPPRRIVSLVPSLTESVASVDVSLVAGATDYCTHPGSLDVPRVGGSKYPSVDAVLAIAPDLVLANVEENRREDIEAIRPAIEAARREGIDASGPWPGDTVFMRARQGEFDIVVAQYHDQGLIPVKYLGIEQGVNVTVGLPFLRTSVDHGTAFDIAGTGKAEHASLRSAIRMAERMLESRREVA